LRSIPIPGKPRRRQPASVVKPLDRIPNRTKAIAKRIEPAIAPIVCVISNIAIAAQTTMNEMTAVFLFIFRTWYDYEPSLTEVYAISTCTGPGRVSATQDAKSCMPRGWIGLPLYVKLLFSSANCLRIVGSSCLPDAPCPSVEDEVAKKQIVKIAPDIYFIFHLASYRI
jgi:hypothetical protein